jgi:hypothetical protein
VAVLVMYCGVGALGTLAVIGVVDVNVGRVDADGGRTKAR